MSMKYITSLFLLILFSCATKEIPLKKVDSVDTQKFMGKWYVIANIPTFIEQGAVNAVETYSWNKKEERIDIDFKFNKDKFDGELKSYPQKAWVYDKSGNEWRVQPFWPLKFAYLIIDLDPDYSYTVIGVPNRKYVWIMARKPVMDEELYKKVVNKIKDQGYDISKIQKVPQVSTLEDQGEASL